MMKDIILESVTMK